MRKANSRRRQIRRGAWALHQRKRKHVGRTFNLSQTFQTEHPKGDSIALLAAVTSQSRALTAVPDVFAPPGVTAVMFRHITSFSVRNFMGIVLLIQVDNGRCN